MGGRGAFEEAAAKARRLRDPAAYRAAADLYAGELLPADRYEAWAEERREGLLVTDERGTPERAVVRVAVSTEAELLPAVVDFVRRVAQRLGLGGTATEELDRAVETVCRNVIECAFDPDEAGQYDIEILRRPGRIAIAVEDRGP